MLLMGLWACGGNAPTNTANPPSTDMETTTEAKSLYDFTMQSIDGKDVPLSTFKGQVVVVVNVASKCGLTPQYADLQEFYDQYKDKGVVVLGFPANNFGGQEPGSEAEIATFCSKNYGVTFPMFAKISVKGDDIHPLYQFLTQKSQNGLVDSKVSWNFQKFVIDREGHVVESFAPTTTVNNKGFLKTIEGLL
jgi:glutathione peroxidase